MRTGNAVLENLLRRTDPAPVVDFIPGTDRLLPFDFSAENPTVSPSSLADIILFCRQVEQLLMDAKVRYGIGGYGELRSVYGGSPVFDGVSPDDEPRRFHLGTDIWGPAGTKIYTPLDAVVHSFAFHDRKGDYGATIILEHEMEGAVFHTLYGHLSLDSISGLETGRTFHRGEEIARFGPPAENGHWPPHLHFQVIADIGEWKGDYPGVCRFSERSTWLANGADPDLLLRLNRWLD